jgi:hypothetical protein
MGTRAHAAERVCAARWPDCQAATEKVPTHFGGQEKVQLACQSAMGSQINSATSMTRSGPA